MSEDLNKPDFVNAEGVKWWLDRATTEYAERHELKNAAVWIVEDKNGVRTRVITIKDEAVAESPSLEGIGAKIDMLAAQQKFNRE